MEVTNRKSLKKVHQWCKWELEEFLDRHPHGFNMKYNLRAEQKIDGQAFRMGYDEDGLFFETSYSGIVRTPELWDPRERDFARWVNFSEGCHNDYGLRKTLEMVKKHYYADELTGYKLVGELVFPMKPEDFAVVITKFDYEKIKPFKFIIRDVEFYGKNGRLRLDGGMGDADDYERFVKERIIWNLRRSYLGKGIFDADKLRLGQMKVTYNFDNADLKTPSGWREARDKMATIFSTHIKTLRVPWGTKDSIPEGIVFHFNERTYGATNYEWLEAKRAKDSREQEYDFTYEDTDGRRSDA